MTTAPMSAFIRHLGALSDTGAPPRVMADETAAALRGLVAQSVWLPAALAAPHPEHYQQYLLYCDPRRRFSIVSFVWGPGQQTPIHDHMVWGAVGQLQGREISINYALEREGLRVTGTDTLEVGDVIAFTPEGGDIHEVRNGDVGVSISIHVYGADIGTISRHVYDRITGASRPFVSGYSPGPAPQWSV